MNGRSAVRVHQDTAACHGRAVQRVIAIMRERLDEELSLHEMANVAIMSPFHFNRTFHQVTGMPPGRFLSALRLERARRLLLTTEQRVTDICFDVGYNSLGTFTRRFTEVLGVSPRRLRSYAGATLPTTLLRAAEQPRAGCPLHGAVEAPPGFSGTIFVGLFPSAVPHGVPGACRVLASTGPFTMTGPPGKFYVYALAVPTASTSLDLLLFENALRASGGIIELPMAETAAPLRLSMRPRAEFDPPILLTLPLLLPRHPTCALRRDVAAPEAVARGGTAAQASGLRRICTCYRTCVVERLSGQSHRANPHRWLSDSAVGGHACSNGCRVSRGQQTTDALVT